MERNRFMGDPIKNSISMNVKGIVVGHVQTNCYLLEDEGESIIIDAGGDTHKIIDVISRSNTTPKVILATHGHFDHVLAVNDLKKYYKIPFLINKDDMNILNQFSVHVKLFLNKESDERPEPDDFLKAEKTINFGNKSIKIIPTPGHTIGSTSFLVEDMLFTGDFIFRGSIGRTDVGGSRDEMRKSLAWLRGLEDDLKLYPGHGEATTLSQEKANNPYLQNE